MTPAWWGPRRRFCAGECSLTVNSKADAVILALAGGCVVLIAVVMVLIRKAGRLRDRLDELEARSRSLSTIYGQISEQWFPLMDRFPYDSRGFRFLGSPVDGIQFEEDRIVFCEFKSNRSALSPVQKRIRELVQSRRVYWEEFHFRSEDNH